MPLYEYWCQACGYKEEKLLTYKKAEEGIFGCPKCGAKLTKRMGNIKHFEFKGKMTRA